MNLLPTAMVLAAMTAILMGVGISGPPRRLAFARAKIASSAGPWSARPRGPWG